MTYFLFILGFIFLIKGADFLVDGASSLSKRLGISSLIIGLTVVAFGTSAPELVVSVLASLEGHNELAIGNIIGSNTANVLLILGVSALIAPLAVKRQTVLKEIPFAILAIVILFIFLQDSLINGAAESMLSRGEGLALLSFFAVFIYYTFVASASSKEEEEIPDMKLSTSIVFIILGLIGLTFGGRWIVDGAILIAQNFGISEAVIGVTIVAIGTSLPELATAGVAAYKGETDLAIGNIVGSNIFNIFLVLGINASIQNIPYNTVMNTDLYVAIISIVLLFLFIIFSKHHKISKSHGVIFLVCYVVYLGSLF